MALNDGGDGSPVDLHDGPEGEVEKNLQWDESDGPECEECKAAQPWLIRLGSQVISIKWECQLCETVQTYRADGDPD